MVSYPDGVASLWRLRKVGQPDPLGFLERLAASGPPGMVPFQLVGRSAFLATDPASAEEVLRTKHAAFAKADGLVRAKRLLGEGLLTAEGERHDRRRVQIQPSFGKAHLDHYAGVIVARARQTRERWSPGEPIDMLDEMGKLTLSIMGQIVFGLDISERGDDVRTAVAAAVESRDPLVSLVAPSAKIRLARAQLAALIDELIARSEPAAEFGPLVVALRSGGVGSDQVRDDALTLLLAGHDTIANALAWTWILLAEHPSVDAAMRQELDEVLGDRCPTFADVPSLGFVRMVLAESLRLFPPAWIIARRALSDVRVGDSVVPRQAVVLVSPYVLHRDARHFANPTEYQPQRWEGLRPGRAAAPAFMPFGLGPRSCIGEGLAWTEGVLLLATIAQQWRFRRTATTSSSPRLRITMRPEDATLVAERVAS